MSFSRPLVVGLSALIALPARAEWQHELAPGLQARASLQAGLAAVTMMHANLGLAASIS